MWNIRIREKAVNSQHEIIEICLEYIHIYEIKKHPSKYDLLYNFFVIMPMSLFYNNKTTLWHEQAILI